MRQRWEVRASQLSTRITLHGNLPAMTDRTDFFSQAWYTLARAIAEAGVNVDLFKTPETIAKSVNQRVRAELKRLAVLLRRLIFLMALQMELAPLTPRIGSNYYEPKKPDAEYRYVFTMVPAPSRPCPHFMKGPVTVPMRGHARHAEASQAPGEMSCPHDPALAGGRRSPAVCTADPARAPSARGHRPRLGRADGAADRRAEALAGFELSLATISKLAGARGRFRADVLLSPPPRDARHLPRKRWRMKRNTCSKGILPRLRGRWQTA